MNSLSSFPAEPPWLDPRPPLSSTQRPARVVTVDLEEEHQDETVPPSPLPLSPPAAAASVLNSDVDVLCLVLTQLAACHGGWSMECERCARVCQLWRACTRRVRNSIEQWSEHTFSIPRFLTRRWPKRARTMEQGEVRPSPPLTLPPFRSNGAHDWQIAISNPRADHRAMRRPRPGYAGKGGLGKAGGLGGSIALGAGPSDAHCLGISLRVPSAEHAPPDWARRVEAFLTVHAPEDCGRAPATVHLRQMLRPEWDELGPAWCIRAEDLSSFLNDDCLLFTVKLRVTHGARECELGTEAHPLRREEHQQELDARGCHYVCDACGRSSLDEGCDCIHITDEGVCS